jgi:dolichol-phosphate mannosyltransferase
MQVSVILPTYNESKNIVALIEALEEQFKSVNISYELVVVDDNSPDGTAKLVQERAQADADVRLFVRTEERGLGTAIKHGIRQAQGEVVAVMDTDFNHDPKMLPQMVKFLEYYDIVIGSRYVMGGGMEDLTRYYFSFLYNVFVRLVLRTQIQDNLSGFFAMRRDKLTGMDLDGIFYGYGEWFMRLLYLAWRRGYAMLEVPVYYVLRRHGQSKSRFVEMILSYTRTVLDLRFGSGRKYGKVTEWPQVTSRPED